MKKYLIGLLSVILFIGCASSNGSNVPAKNVTGFTAAINAYDATKKIEYLKQASNYATSKNEKAILERKMVDYLGVDKVFDVKITTRKLGKLLAVTKKGTIDASKGTKQKIDIDIKITPRKNLPFTLKYNSYKISLLVKKVLTQIIKNDDGVKEMSSKSIILQTPVNLTPANHWTYQKRVYDHVYPYHKYKSFFYNASYTLKNLEYFSEVQLMPKNTILYDPNTHIEWQNFYPTTNGNNVKIIKLSGSSANSEAKNYCKNLTLNGKGWHYPSLDQLKSLANNKVLVSKMKKTDIPYSDKGLSMYDDAIRLSDGAQIDQKFNAISGVRCVRDKK